MQRGGCVGSVRESKVVLLAAIQSNAKNVHPSFFPAPNNLENLKPYF